MKKNNTLIMGIVNITPDSFSDGGDYLEPSKAIDHCLKLVDDGADILDLGAESTRPGSSFISDKEEWKRLEPVLTKLKDLNVKAAISIDSSKEKVILNALDFNIDYINNVKGLFEEDFLKQLAKNNLNYIAMHMKGEPKTMQQDPLDGASSVDYMWKKFNFYFDKLTECGFEKHQIFLDPGIGFGKTDSANLYLISKATNFSKSFNMIYGLSRKSFIGRTLDIENPKDRDSATKMIELSLLFSGVNIIRTHDVARLYKLKKTLQS